jgi:hypothetical protein
MKHRGFAVLVLMAFSIVAAADDGERIRVIPMAGPGATFTFGDICKFDSVTTPLPDEPVRVRIIRGTREYLERYGTNGLNLTGACVDYYSIVVRPIRAASGRLDLNIAVGQGWLDGANDGHFVFVLEADDDPGASRIEYRKLRLAPELTDDYFGDGKEVTVRAPVERIALTPQNSSRSMYRGLTAECAALNRDPRRIIIRQATVEPQDSETSVGGQQ